jgi:hypothetical protein
MNTLVIVHETSEGVALTSPASDDIIDAVLAASVTEGARYAVIPTADLPAPEYLSALAIDDTSSPPSVYLDPVKKAAVDVAKALAEVDAWFAGEIAKGFVTDDGWKLGLSESDVTLLTGHYVLAKEASALGLPVPPVIDADGVPHAFESIQDLTALMLGYGQHRAELSMEYAARKAAAAAGDE